MASFKLVSHKFSTTNEKPSIEFFETLDSAINAAKIALAYGMRSVTVIDRNAGKPVFYVNQAGNPEKWIFE